MACSGLQGSPPTTVGWASNGGGEGSARGDWLRGGGGAPGDGLRGPGREGTKAGKRKTLLCECGSVFFCGGGVELLGPS